VPISIVYKKGFKRDGRAPLLLYGYGAYGYGQSPNFASNRVSLLDRGFAFAIAHIRGGNEMGVYDYMKSYSPYDNLQKKAYPAILVTTSFNDSQVMSWGPVKYVAKLRTLKTDQNELLLKIKMDPAGHGGASGRYDRLRDTAFEYAWILRQVAIRK